MSRTALKKKTVPICQRNFSRINKDAFDARRIREARGADKGKARYTINELRAQRGLAAI